MRLTGDTDGGGRCTDVASSITLLNAMKDSYNLHYAITDNSAYFTTGTSVMPQEWKCASSFWCKTNVSNHAFATTEFRTA